MQVFTTVAGIRCYLEQARQRQLAIAQIQTPSFSPSVTVGLVPTMGALHEGHLSLIRAARQANDIVVVSIFVNPLQFGPHEDFQHYPRTLERDQELCEQAQVDAIFAPQSDDLYRPSAIAAQGLAHDALTQVIPPKAMMETLCGPFRPGHFPGVATVVAKLLSIVQPTRAYFGQKDAQQLAILRRVVADLNLPVELVGCPIVREESGLALSSRNQYLSLEERTQATVLYRSLKKAEQAFQNGHRLSHDLITIVKDELATAPEVKPQYVELVHPITLMPLDEVENTGLLAIAAYVGSTRLIDNIVLRHRQPIVAIDGPAGAGKSTVVRQVAHELGLLYLDTGAMYRAVTWLVLQSGIAVDDEPAIAELVSRCQIHLAPGDAQSDKAVAPCRVWINEHEVTQAIRSLEVTAHVSAIAAQPIVRRELVKQQQAYGCRGGIVIDGRDIGTHVFPDAELKIFLTASVQERARRRQQDLRQQGLPDASLEDLEAAIYERDRKDSSRQYSPLKKASDAIELQTDGLTVDQVTQTIVNLYRDRLQSA